MQRTHMLACTPKSLVLLAVSTCQLSHEVPQNSVHHTPGHHFFCYPGWSFLSYTCRLKAFLHNLKCAKGRPTSVHDDTIW